MTAGHSQKECPKFTWGPKLDTLMVVNSAFIKPRVNVPIPWNMDTWTVPSSQQSVGRCHSSCTSSYVPVSPRHLWGGPMRMPWHGCLRTRVDHAGRWSWHRHSCRTTTGVQVTVNNKSSLYIQNGPKDIEVLSSDASRSLIKDYHTAASGMGISDIRPCSRTLLVHFDLYKRSLFQRGWTADQDRPWRPRSWDQTEVGRSALSRGTAIQSRLLLTEVPVESICELVSIYVITRCQATPFELLRPYDFVFRCPTGNGNVYKHVHLWVMTLLKTWCTLQHYSCS